MTGIKQNKVYYPELDIIKGIAILLVIYGHSMCYFPINIRDMFPTLAYDAVTKFHMQLFFIASGFLFSAKDTWKDFLKKKSIRILVPYIAFCLIDGLLRYIAAPFTRSHMHVNVLSVIVNGTHFWFLHALFFIYIIAKLANGKRWIYLLMLFLSVSLHLFLPDGNWKEILGLEHIIYFLAWFIAGIFLRDIYAKINTYLNTWWMVLLLALLSGLTLVFGLNKFFVLTWYIYPILCSLLVWSISLALVKTNWTQKGFTYFGKYSLQYYINHHVISLGAYYVPYLLNLTNPFICLGSVFVTQLCIAWLMLVIEDTNNITRFISGLPLKNTKV